MLTLIKHAISMRRTQSLATLLSVAIASAVVLALALSFLGVRGGLERSAERMGADLMVIPAEAAVGLDENALLFTGTPANMYMDESVADEVAQVEGVERVSAQFFGQTLDASCCSASTPSRLVGIDPRTDWVVSPWADADLSGLGEGQIVVGADMEADFSQNPRVLGHSVQVAAVLDATGSDLDGSVLMSIDQVRSFVRETPELAYLWEEYGDPDSLVSCVMVNVADGFEDAVAAELSSREGLYVVQGSATVDRVADQLGSVFAIMLGAAALLVAATLFQLFARFFSLAWDRRSELALYRALGASRREISLLIVGEAAILVGGGVAVGIVLGAVLFVAVPGVLAGAGSFPFIAPSPGACVLCALGTAVLFAAIGLAAVVWPLVRAGRIDPSAAMQTGDID